MLTAQQIKLVQDSWKTITPVSTKMGEEFYSRLFEKHPDLRAMFKSEPKDQVMKLMFMISYLVYRLDQMPELKEEISKLAVRHKGYGTEPGHYAIIGEHLLWSLEQNMGDLWTAETAEAWQKTYSIFADLMIKAQQNN
jgi:hemoglobin-like flavoprotein